MKKFALILLILLLSFIFIVLNFNSNLSKKRAGNLTFEIPRGATISAIIDSLNSKGYFQPKIEYKFYLKIYAALSRKKIFAGIYLLPDSVISNKKIIESIFSGKNLNVARVTFPEGITIYDFASILKEKLGMDSASFIKACKTESILRNYGIKAKSAEGYLMPETYDFFKGVKPDRILKILLQTRKEIWDDKFAAEIKEKKLDAYDVLTLASIVEAESPLPDERPRVAGLYTNRLKRGMLLQSDPTVQYAIGYRRRLSFKDLTIENHYNTYLYPGLPPGPINNPGINSIEAAINPEKNDYIYMVAVGDGSGRHNFALNKEQHDHNVALYRRERRSK